MANLRSQIEEEHLTCSICYSAFTNPKALPCLHTFCEHCIREYVASRGFEEAGEFPCPTCRATVPIPAGGIEQFPNNHLMKSLSDTVDQSKPKSAEPKPPVPKPRKSLGQPVQPQPQQTQSKCGEPLDPPPPYSAGAPPPQQGGYGYPAQGNWVPPQPQVQNYLPPYYPAQPFVPPPGQYPATVPPPGQYPPTVPPPGQYPTTVPPPGQPEGSSVIEPPPNPYRGAALYPTIPTNNTVDPSSTACSLGLLLRFGKKGAHVTDFQKPLGLAVSDACDFVVTDTNGSKIFVFDYQGRPKKAFHCDCRIKDVAVNSRNEIVVVVNKPAATFRVYDMSGRCLGEHGKSITHEEAHGVALLVSGGAVITGKQNHSVYVLTDQYKLCTKFGRKGTGDGYFMSPAFVAADSKGHVVVSDDVNHCVQVFNAQGKFKLRFGGEGSGPGQLLRPLGVATDTDDNIFVADSGNCRVEMFSPRGHHLRSIVSSTEQLGENVRPVNVATTPKGQVAVLLRGNYFAEVRLYSALTSSSSNKDSVSCFKYCKLIC